MTKEKTKSLAKILIADDKVDYRKSIAAALFSDYETDFASNADEEIEKAKQNQYSLILTDNQMEDGYGNSGIYAIGQIRKFDKKVPIVFHTADNASEIFMEALLVGANEAMSKITNLEGYEKVIKKYLP